MGKLCPMDWWQLKNVRWLPMQWIGQQSLVCIILHGWGAYHLDPVLDW